MFSKGMPVAASWLAAARAGLLVLLAVQALAGRPALAQPADSAGVIPTPPLPVLKATRAENPIDIDARLREPDWDRAEAATQFTQLDPVEGAPASERTEVRVLFDGDAVYIGARLHDRNPSGIRAHLARRDYSSDSDLFMVFIDSFHDRLTASRFDVNPAGAIRDASIYADGNQDFSWDPVWESMASIDSLGWVVEIRIPLSQLRYNATDETTWGIQFVRLIHRNQEESYFSFTPKREDAGVSRYGHLTGLGKLPHHRNVELVPYLLSRGTFATVENGDPFRSESDFDGQAGLDLRYGLGSDLTLSGTINPDFGQAEVDPAVVNLSAYETFYPEKRPFFVTDAGNFSFGRVRTFNNFGFGETFYSRRIGRPPQLQLSSTRYSYVDQPDQSTIAGAAKLTGKTRSGWTVGVLEAITLAEMAEHLDTTGVIGKTRVEPATNYLVGRVARDLRGGQTQLGALLTAANRDLDTPALEGLNRSAAYTGGVEWKHAWKRREWSFDGFLLGSNVRGSEEAIARTQLSSAHYFARPDADHVSYDPTRTSLSGYHGTAALAKNSGEHWRGSLMSQFMSPGYEVNDLGFMNRADRYTATSIVMYSESKPGPLFRYYEVYPFTYHAWNYGNKMTAAGYALGWYSQLANYWQLSSQGRFEAGTYNDQLTRGGPIARSVNAGQFSLNLTSDSRRSWTLNLGGVWYANAEGGRNQSYDASISFHPTPGVQLSVGPSFDNLHSVSQYVLTRFDETAVNTYGGRYVFANLDQKTLSLETRMNWVFSPKVSLQLYLQPLISSADYTEFKEFREPATFDFDVYGEDRGTINREDGLYVVDPDAGGAAPSFAFADPDFNFRSLRGNAVLRWEYRPGSTFFLIWQQSRSETGEEGDFDLGRDTDAMIDAAVENILMAKITTWFGW